MMTKNFSLTTRNHQLQYPLDRVKPKIIMLAIIIKVAIVLQYLQTALPTIKRKEVDSKPSLSMIKLTLT